MDILSTLGAAGITVRIDFVPQSLSRNAGKEPCVNWRVTFTRRGSAVPFEYMQGSGHIPWPPLGERSLSRTCVMGDDMIRASCESGRRPGLGGKLLEAPDIADVMQSLCLDSDALNYGCFEDWASEFGYDTDSRSAEAIYRACLDTALQLRAMIGAELLATISEAVSGR